MIYASPISFPSIPIKRCLSSIVQNRILLQSEGVIFEFCYDKPLKESMFGNVYKGKVVENSRGDSFPYQANDMIAIKTISKFKLSKESRSHGENPISEYYALQYIQSIGSHPNIVQSIDFLEDDEYYYSIMEFIDGSDLFDFVNASAVKHSDIKVYFKQIMNAVKFINKHGIVHRDLSLENIMITKDLQIKLIDFGMALRKCTEQPLDVFFHPQGSVGKKSFVCPEIFENRCAFNPLLVDIWSLGAILFALLTGSVPLESPAPHDVCFRYISSDRLHVIVERWGLDIPDPAVNLIQQMLQVQATKRIHIDAVISHAWLELN